MLLRCTWIWAFVVSFYFVCNLVHPLWFHLILLFLQVLYIFLMFAFFIIFFLQISHFFFFWWMSPASYLVVLVLRVFAFSIVFLLICFWLFRWVLGVHAEGFLVVLFLLMSNSVFRCFLSQIGCTKLFSF